MDAVALVQSSNTRYILQQEWNERNAVLGCEQRIDVVKRGRVLSTPGRRRFHSRENDADAPVLRLLDDTRKVLPKFLDGKSAQAIVAAKRKNQNPDVSRQCPVETREASRGGVT